MSKPDSDGEHHTSDGGNHSDEWGPSDEWNDPASLDAEAEQDWDEGIFGGADHDMPIEPGDPSFENALFVVLGSLSTLIVLFVLLGVI